MKEPNHSTGETSEEPENSSAPDADQAATTEGGERTDLSIEEMLEYARDDTLDFLEGLLDAMGLEGEVTAEIAGEAIQARIDGGDLGVLIGRHGRTLEAVQELLRAAVQRQAQTRVRLNLDIEGYREGRRQVLAQHAQDMAQDALREGEVRLEPMGAFERKIVHDTIAEIAGVTSESEGEEPDRRVVIRATQGGSGGVAAPREADPDEQQSDSHDQQLRPPESSQI